MRLADFITESPIADFAYTGGHEPESFEANDLKAIHNPKWKEKLVKTFAKTPVPINIYVINKKTFYNTTNAYSKEPQRVYIDRTLSSLRDIAGQYSEPDFRKNFGFTPRDYATSISFVFTNNHGTDKFVFTPWMVAHRAIHAMINGNFGAGRSPFQTDRMFDEYFRTMREVIDMLVDATYEKKFGDDGVKKGSPKYYSRTEQIEKEVMTRAATFKSAKAGYSEGRSGEFYIELATQYLLFGKLVFKIDDFDDVLSEEKMEDFRDALAYAKRDLDRMLQAAVGGIFVL